LLSSLTAIHVPTVSKCQLLAVVSVHFKTGGDTIPVSAFKASDLATNHLSGCSSSRERPPRKTCNALSEIRQARPTLRPASSRTHWTPLTPVQSLDSDDRVWYTDGVGLVKRS